MEKVIQALSGAPRLRLSQLPTPIQRMRRVEDALGLTGRGPEIYLKRDDLTGLAFGGNKGRKLEFLLADAQTQGVDCVLMAGNVQSNCCRQAAVVGRAMGLDVQLFLSGPQPERITGNLLPSALAGAELHFHAGPAAAEAAQKVAEERLLAAGRKPYIIPRGGSNAVGTLGYLADMIEIREQEQRLGFGFDQIFLSSGSGGTQAGLVLGRKLLSLKVRIVGVAINPLKEIAERRQNIVELAAGAAKRLDLPVHLDPEDVEFVADYAGPCYGVPNPGGEKALRMFAALEGVFLDNAYTAKAMSGLLDYIKTGRIKAGERVLFIHTGGQLGLFA